MPKGAKKGENRFAGSQKKLLDDRYNRIHEVVKPTIQSYVGKITIKGKAAYCKLCAEIFNKDLPVNEKKISYRTIEQNLHYWSLLGPIFHRHWDSKEGLENSKTKLTGQLAARENQRLKNRIDELNQWNEALQTTLRNHGAELTDEQYANRSDDAASNYQFELTCRALKIVIDASNGSFAIDKAAKKITRTWDDLEDESGLVSKELLEPFLEWLSERDRKTGGRS